MNSLPERYASIKSWQKVKLNSGPCRYEVKSFLNMKETIVRAREGGWAGRGAGLAFPSWGNPGFGTIPVTRLLRQVTAEWGPPTPLSRDDDRLSTIARINCLRPPLPSRKYASIQSAGGVFPPPHGYTSLTFQWKPRGTRICFAAILLRASLATQGQKPL